ncbi:recombination regulator RecX [Jatrophihabitans cynanchi]|jgi:regulatory protein|uniref:Regulatory protein RecX n=1 Tax=Jatrophihabitans cynanchi TaxID=2944128 RepID=A0ABY7JZS8_9ACTN|nr:regulatory protein RecX [Jatrophihabitans sp. SB3-54]WAX57455.1 recombination regulator RecX [Jatrophihabitans sp. SB3-54]
MPFEAQPAVEAHPEDEVPPEDEKALGPPGDPETVARTICLRLLDQRARTRAELADALRRKGVPDEPAAAVLDRFAEVGLIDDEALAGTFALAQHRERGLARRAVAVKLRRRGLDEQVVAAALGPIDRDSEYAAARTLVAKKLRSLSGLDPQAQARRLVGLLGRRGYPAGLAHEVVREALAAAMADTSTLDDAAADLT